MAPDTAALPEGWTATYMRDGEEWWSCCGKRADPGTYTTSDHCTRCHQPVSQALEGCPRHAD